MDVVYISKEDLVEARIRNVEVYLQEDGTYRSGVPMVSKKDPVKEDAKRIMELIDSDKDKLKDGVYKELCDITKKLYDYSL